MAYFVYEAVNESGKKVKGQIQSPNKHAAVTELTGRGLILRSIQERPETLLTKEFFIGRPVKLEDFVIFCRQFATLIRSGIQIDQALGILEDQTTSKYLKRALGEVYHQVRSGRSLSSSMAQHPKIFPEMFVHMIESAEASGSMEEVLLRMADHYEKEHKTVEKIKSAMTYPIIVLVVAIAVLIFLLTNIVPKFTAMFADLGAELPLITKFIMALSDFVQASWLLIFIVAIGLVVGLRFALRDEQIRYHWDGLKFKIPVFGSVIQKAAIARMARTMASLFASAVPVMQTLAISKKVVGNKVLAEVLDNASNSLAQGKQLSEPFRESKMFPKMVIQMLTIGEETGQVDNMLVKIAEFYEDEVEQNVDRLKAMLEPVMMLFLAGLVGIIVAAIMTPMFSLYDAFLR
ncbi:phytochrome sensor protein [Insulibacter thermoxylanivorax]|uniref:Phytochrome sensor protein n=1 Tax=Insulibacter thermoxylanivorax TaxID=2749268 RepID=A0A916VHH5_9BACL|nr:type II secretion system F family protein [Insulibacter thermoxylanivorax]GFR38360.1 phytochrome sensor protein [Insulibacter thermoxylanivorax]